MIWNDYRVLRFLNWYLREQDLPEETIEIVKRYRDPNLGNDWINSILTQYGVTLKDIRSKSRKGDLPFVRHLIAYLLNIKGYSHLQVGLKINRNHTSVNHAKKVINNYIDTDEIKRKEIKDWIEIMKDNL